MTDHAKEVIPLDTYIADLEQAINESYWEGDDDEAQQLRNRIEYAKFAKESGELYYVPW
jgi:hypothetical protein